MKHTEIIYCQQHNIFSFLFTSLNHSANGTQITTLDFLYSSASQHKTKQLHYNKLKNQVNNEGNGISLPQKIVIF